MAASKPREFTGLHMAIVMVTGFGIVIAVNIYMAVMATSTFNGLTAKNGYVASIDFAQDQKNIARAAELGWTVDVAAEPDRVALDLTAADGTPLVARVTGTVEPPTGGNAVRPLDFAAIGTGRYRAPIELAPGRWVIRTELESGGERLPWRAIVDVDPQ